MFLNFKPTVIDEGLYWRAVSEGRIKPNDNASAQKYFGRLQKELAKGKQIPYDPDGWQGSADVAAKVIRRNPASKGVVKLVDLILPRYD